MDRDDEVIQVREVFVVGMKARDKYEALEEIVDHLASHGLLPDRDTALQSLCEREAAMSTGIAPRVGLPHTKLHGLQGVLVRGWFVSREGVEYDSLDGEPVYLIVCYLSEVGDTGRHLHVLNETNVLLCIPGMLDTLLAARDSVELRENVTQELAYIRRTE